MAAAARKPAEGKVVAVVPLSHAGRDIAADQDLRELGLTDEQIAGLVERGEAQRV